MIKNNYKRQIFVGISIYSLITFMLLSCQNIIVDKATSNIINEAARNKDEFYKVLKHYSDKKDSLKYKSAVFLIKNIEHQYAKSFDDYDKFSIIFDSLEHYRFKNKNIPNEEVKRLFYSFKIKQIWGKLEEKNGKFEAANFSKIKDIDVIKADFLIENIDYAFKAWELPWAKNLNFEQFCKYILPYRYGHEELQNWRADYFEEFKWVLDSAKGETDPIKVCAILNTKLRSDFTFSYNSALKNISDLRPLDFLKAKVLSTCIDQNSLSMLAMRSIGIPVCHIEIPQWGDRSMGHHISAVLDKNNHWITFLGAEFNPGKNIFRNKVPKAYIKNFALQKRSVFSLVDSRDSLPNIVKNAEYEDVTSSIIPTTKIILEAKNVKSKVGYLCVFDNEEWIPIDYAEIKGDRMEFINMGRDITYLPALYKNQRILPIGNPFFIDSLGQIIQIEKSKATESITLSRKYPYNQRLITMSSVTIGGRFQGANKKDFKDAKDLYVITKLPPQYPVTKNINPRKFRYVRYIFPSSKILQGGITNIGFYEYKNHQLNKLKGQYISSTEVSRGQFDVIFNDSTSYIDDIKFINGMEGLSFDGYVLVDKSKNNLWVGLDLGKPCSINKIGFMPRNDLNGIYSGQEYELYYWDDYWRSAGTKIASGPCINFKNVPKGALLLLKNITNGNENRIFTFNNTKQIWH